MDTATSDSMEPIRDIDEDKYEDAGELGMSSAQEKLYLTRMPKMVWEALSHMNEEDEINIGTLRVEGDRSNPSKASLSFNSGTEAFKYIPREFNMRPTGKSNANTFVFSEQNLPGFTKKYRPNKGPSIINRQGIQERGSNKPSTKGSRRTGYRRAIPKKTAVVGHVQSEFTCLPVENEQYARVMEQRARNISKPKHELQLLEGNTNISTMMTTGSFGSNGAFNKLIKGTPQHQKKQQQKATRLPKNELRDLLFDCFRQYKFWYIRDLKQKTQQPEPWLRECLEDIAEHVRQGTRANTWRLKPSSTLDPSIFDGTVSLGGFEAAEEGVAPAAIDYDASDVAAELEEEENDSNIKMEDVKMTK